MFSVAECRIKADEKRALAFSSPQRRRKHPNAAESWLFLANSLEPASLYLNHLAVALLSSDEDNHD